MTPLCAAMDSVAPSARAAACTAAPRGLQTLAPLRTLGTLPDRLVRRAEPLQLEAEVQVVLRAVLVEGARLVLVERIVLERRVVQVHGIERDREMIVHGVPQRCR